MNTTLSDVLNTIAKAVFTAYYMGQFARFLVDLFIIEPLLELVELTIETVTYYELPEFGILWTGTINQLKASLTSQGVTLTGTKKWRKVDWQMAVMTHTGCINTLNGVRDFWF